jgi:hypothetical protein
MQITIKINTNEAPPSVKAIEQTNTMQTESVIELTADEWTRRQTAIHAKAA